MPARLQSPTAIIVLLAIVNLLNYADRFLLSALTPHLGEPLAAGGLGLTDLQIGLLGTAFMVVHSVASVPLGVLADRFSRKKLIAIGVALWSVATATAGVARTYAQMFVARASVGIGEATYAPAASALISDTFKPEARARALGFFQMGMVLGGGFGIVVGGIVAGRFGWRGAFFVFGLPGLLIAALAMLIDEAPRGASSGRKARASGSFSLEAREFFRSPALVWINVAGIFVTFCVGALTFWGPKFILVYHYGGRVAMNARATTLFGSVAIPAAALGAVVGSALADRIERRRPGEGRLLAIAVGSFLAAPCAIAGYYATYLPLVLIVIGLASFFMTWYVGPVLAALHEVVLPERRGTATGAYFLLVHLLGDAISPTVVGMVSRYTASLRLGLVIATMTLVAGALAALRARHFTREAARKRAASSPVAT